jgi:hypothetical protein
MRIYLLLSVMLVAMHGMAQQKKSENIVIVTMDGLRWQEMFNGADSLLTFDTAAIYSHKYAEEHYWAGSAEERRKKLFPFIWSEISAKGMLLGNRKYENYFENKNPYWFSYPGYNEIFTGFPDTAVNSNDKIPNKNESVLEYLNKMPQYKNKVAVFGSWDVFAYIFNEKRSGLPVNDGFRNVEGKLTDKQKMFNQLQHEMPAIFHEGERLDVATFNMGFEYMKANKPRIMFFGLGDTDEFAHAGMYDYYLDAAHKTDAWIKKLWEYIQSDPAYANKTTLIIATDHGRGLAEGGNWKHHGQKIPESKQMWMAAIGPSVPAIGESKSAQVNYQGQIAATIAQMLGHHFAPAHQPLPALSIK